MRKNSLKIAGIIALFVIPFTLMNCGSSTQVTGSWKNPDVGPTNYTSILVTALTPNVVARRAVESQIAEQLESKGVIARPSIEVFPPNFMTDKPSKEQILDKVRAEGVNGIMTVALIDSQEDTKYVPGSNMYAPYPRYGYYGSFGGYYGNYYSTFYDPGYYTTSRTYFVETNLYDVGTEDLVWSAQSKSYDPSNIESASRALGRALVYEMGDDGIISK